MLITNAKETEMYIIDPIDASGDFDERNHSLDKILSEKNYGFRLTEGFNLLNDGDPTYGEENMF